MSFLTRRLFIYGRVQGVGFRWSLANEAKRLRLAGWVRNRRDGSVEALVGGTPEAIGVLTQWAWTGPPSARVDRVLGNDEPDAENLAATTDFHQRPTF